MNYRDKALEFQKEDRYLGLAEQLVSLDKCVFLAVIGYWNMQEYLQTFQKTFALESE